MMQLSQAEQWSVVTMDVFSTSIVRVNFTQWKTKPFFRICLEPYWIIGLTTCSHRSKILLCCCLGKQPSRNLRRWKDFSGGCNGGFLKWWSKAFFPGGETKVKLHQLKTQRKIFFTIKK